MSVWQTSHRLLRLGIDAAMDAWSVWKASNTSSPLIPSPPAPKRVTFAQFGCYAEGFRRLSSGGAEDYYAQKYTVDFVGSLLSRSDVEHVSVVCLGRTYPQYVLDNGVYVSGVDLYGSKSGPRYGETIDLIASTRPTHLVVLTPSIPLISWGLKSGCRVLPLLADSFRLRGLVASVRYRLLSTLLNTKLIPVVGNHNLAASLDLRRIGVRAEKIIPFDWPALISPEEFRPKNAPSPEEPFRLLYVGAVIEAKGVTDVIRAVSLLKARGDTRRAVTLSIIGSGELDKFTALAAAEGVGDAVFFLGQRPHAEVIAAMRNHDAVIVPSRWAYPEGLPMTLYEALCSRTPLLASDHPMFSLKIVDNYNGLIFKEKSPESCAACILALSTKPGLYEKLSLNAGQTASNYLCPLKYHQLISAFLDDSDRFTDELRAFSLATLQGEATLAA